jgi:hypothetical protein
VYFNQETGILIVMYIDNILIIRKDKSKIKTLKHGLATKFKIEDIRSVNYFIGVRITRDREKKTILLCQDAYVAKILERF